MMLACNRCNYASVQRYLANEKVHMISRIFFTTKFQSWKAASSWTDLSAFSVNSATLSDTRFHGSHWATRAETGAKGFSAGSSLWSWCFANWVSPLPSGNLRRPAPVVWTRPDIWAFERSRNDPRCPMPMAEVFFVSGLKDNAHHRIVEERAIFWIMRMIPA